MMRNGTCLALLLAAACAPGGPSGTWPSGTWVDLTHAFSEETVYWPTAEGFKLERVARGMTEQGYFYAANRFSAAEHGGTHLDAPIHFAKGKNSSEQIPLEQLLGPACVVDVSQKCLADPDYRIRVEDLLAHEAKHGRIPAGAILLLHTGFGRYWPDRKRYMGTDQRGQKATRLLHFPGLHPKAAEWLVSERDIDAVGLDTPSIDRGRSLFFRAHRILFEHDIPAFENVAGLDRLPATGAFVIALPMKIRGGTGGPLRIVALVPE